MSMGLLNENARSAHVRNAIDFGVSVGLSVGVFKTASGVCKLRADECCAHATISQLFIADCTWDASSLEQLHLHDGETPLQARHSRQIAMMRNTYW